MHRLAFAILLLLFSSFTYANNSRYAQLAASTQTIILHETSDQAASYTEYAAIAENVV